MAQKGFLVDPANAILLSAAQAAQKEQVKTLIKFAKLSAAQAAQKLYRKRRRFIFALSAAQAAQKR